MDRYGHLFNDKDLTGVKWSFWKRFFNIPLKIR